MSPPILSKFPDNFRPRDVQTDILNRVEESLKSYKKIIISAPTGVGKSPIGITIARHLGSSFIVTALKQLQDQYSKEYPTLIPVKGQSNYPCLKLMEKKGIEDKVLAAYQELTCEKGQCTEGKGEDGKTIFCKFKPDLKSIVKDDKSGSSCEYYQAKFEALTSDHSIWNYHGYFQLMLNSSTYSEYLGKNVGIFDEAHKIEDQILGFIGITITGKQLAECNIKPDRFDLTDMDDILELLDSMRRSYAKMLQEMDEGDANRKRQSEYEDNIEQIVRVRTMINVDKENYIVDETVREEITGEFSRISVKPIEVGKYVGMFFTNKIQVFMSATINKKSFCHSMGIDESEVAFIDTPRSPFAIENRKIQFAFCGPQGQSGTQKNRMDMIRKIDEILDKHASKRGLILTSSKARCNEIERGLSARNQGRIRQCHSQNKGGKTQDQVIGDHGETDDSVLLSSSLWEGVDLAGDLSRFQIIAKIPYPDLSNRRNSIRREKHPWWFNSQAVMKTLQGCGRSIRSENDWAETYVLDSAFQSLIRHTWDVIPAAYHDVLEIAGQEQIMR